MQIEKFNFYIFLLNLLNCIFKNAINKNLATDSRISDIKFN